MKLQLAYIFLLFLSVVGALLIGNVVHEYSHYQDFHKYAVEDSEFICLLGYSPSNFTSSPMAYYSYEHTLNQSSSYYLANSYTEYKAYGLMFIFLCIFFICVFYIYYYNKQREEEYDLIYSGYKELLHEKINKKS